MITDHEFKKLCHLACLSLGDAETIALQKDMQQIIAFAQHITSLSSDDNFMKTDTESVALREDICCESLPLEKTLQNAPEKLNDFIAVKGSY